MEKEDEDAEADGSRTRMPGENGRGELGLAAILGNSG